MSEPTMPARDEDAETAARSDAARRGRAIYEAKLKALLEPEYNNRFVAIHPASGEYAVADSTGNAMRAIRKSRPWGRLYLTKIGPEPEYRLTARILMADLDMALERSQEANALVIQRPPQPSGDLAHVKITRAAE